MQIYNVYQSGKRLYIDEKENPDNKIACNKYESGQTTLRLISDGTLPPRLYWALRNPKLSNKYFILPLINNEDLVIDTSVTATPGLWDLILVGTPDDYIIEGTDIDQSKLTYISDTFSRLFVRDNYLEELDIEEQVPHNWMVFYDEIIFQLSQKEESKFVAEYGVTTFEELEEAYQNSRNISALKTEGKIKFHASLHAKSNTLYIFNAIEENTLHQFICDKDSNWTCVDLDLTHPTNISAFEYYKNYIVDVFLTDDGEGHVSIGTSTQFIDGNEVAY